MTKHDEHDTREQLIEKYEKENNIQIKANIDREIYGLDNYEQGYAQALKDVEKIIEDIGHYVLIDIQTEGEVKGFKLWLKQELVKESK